MSQACVDFDGTGAKVRGLAVTAAHSREWLLCLVL